MSDKERIIQMLDAIPEYKFGYVIAYLKGIQDGAETLPDEWDLKMISEAENVNDGTSVAFEELLERDGLTYADI